MGWGSRGGVDNLPKIGVRRGALLVALLAVGAVWALVVGNLGPKLLQTYTPRTQELTLEVGHLKQALIAELQARPHIEAAQLEAQATLAKALREKESLAAERQLLKKEQQAAAEEAKHVTRLEAKVKQEEEAIEAKAAELAKEFEKVKELEKAAKKLVEEKRQEEDAIKAEWERLKEEQERLAGEAAQLKEQLGEITEGHMVKGGAKKRGSRIMLVTAVQPEPCETGGAGEVTFLKSLKNKVDYTRAQGMSLWFSRELLSSDYFLYWNKLRLVRSLMDNAKVWEEHDWFIWVDYDILITDFDFVPPVHSYPAEASIAFWGDEEKFFSATPDLQYGLNLGLIMFRKSEATKAFLDEWMAIGKASEGEKYLEAANRITLNNFSGPKFCDQKALLYLLNVLRPDLKHHVHLLSDAETDYTINGWYQHELWKIQKWLKEGKKPEHADRTQRWPFVVHYAGCQFCSITYAPVGQGAMHYPKCLQAWDRMYNFVDNFALAELGFRHKNFLAVEVESGTIQELLPYDPEKVDQLLFGNDMRWSLPCLGDQCRADGSTWAR